MRRDQRVASISIDVGIQSDLTSRWRDLGNPTRPHDVDGWMAGTLVSQRPLYGKANTVGPVASAGYLVCLRVKLASSTSLVWCRGSVRKGRQKNAMCGARWTCLLWLSCGEALHRRKGNKGGSRHGSRRGDRRIGIPTHVDVLHGGINTACTACTAIGLFSWTWHQVRNG